MKKWVVALIVVLCWPILWAGNEDNLTFISGSVLTSTGDSEGVFTIPTATQNILFANPAVTTWTSTSTNLVAIAKEEILKRYISAWIIDQDENVPLEKSLIYEKTMLFTDKTPDEIRAGIPLLDLLDAHNKVRLGMKDKEGKTLKKIRLRDLQIVIKNW